MGPYKSKIPAYLNMGFAILVDKCKWEEFLVFLNSLLIPPTSNKTLGIKHGVLGVAGQLILGSISNQTLGLSRERNV